MRGKKRVTRGSITSQENKTSNRCPETNKIENSGLHSNGSISVETLIIGLSLNSNVSQSIKENPEMANVRRSGHIKNSASPGGATVAKPAMEHVNASKNYKEGAPRSSLASNLHVEKEPNLEGATQVQQDIMILNKLEEKINYLVQAVDALKAQVFEQPPGGSNEDNSSNLNYKNLYLDSQKKIDALLEENFKLIKMLEYARGEVAADKTSNGCPETNNIENSGLHANDTISVEALIIGDKVSLNSNASQSRKENPEMTDVRRSGQIKNSTSPGGTTVAKPATEHVNASENYKEGAPCSPSVSNLPVSKESDLEGGTQVQQDSRISNKLEEKINYLVQAVDAFKAQVFEQPPGGSNEDNSSDSSYKNLYLDSQKKVDALIERNFKLIKRLEYARGEVATYQRMEVLFVRAADATALTAQRFHPLTSPPTTASPSDTAVLPVEKGNSKKRKVGKP